MQIYVLGFYTKNYSDFINSSFSKQYLEDYQKKFDKITEEKNAHYEIFQIPFYSPDGWKEWANYAKKENIPLFLNLSFFSNKNYNLKPKSLNANSDFSTLINNSFKVPYEG